jgi:hypothetical protein
MPLICFLHHTTSPSDFANGHTSELLVLAKNFGASDVFAAQLAVLLREHSRYI